MNCKRLVSKQAKAVVKAIGRSKTLRQPILAACRSCSHVWPLAFLPCELSVLGKTAPKACPWCGAPPPEIKVATRLEGDYARYAAWCLVEAKRAVAAVGEPKPKRTKEMAGMPLDAVGSATAYAPINR